MRLWLPPNFCRARKKKSLAASVVSSTLNVCWTRACKILAWTMSIYTFIICGTTKHRLLISWKALTAWLKRARHVTSASPIALPGSWQKPTPWLNEKTLRNLFRCKIITISFFVKKNVKWHSCVQRTTLP